MSLDRLERERLRSFDDSLKLLSIQVSMVQRTYSRAASLGLLLSNSHHELRMSLDETLELCIRTHSDPSEIRRLLKRLRA